MNFIIIGSAGGLGSYLFNSLNKLHHSIVGLDIIPADTVTKVLDTTKLTKESITESLCLFNGPCAIIISIAPRSRSKGIANCSSIKSDSSDYLCANSDLLIDVADCLQNFSSQFNNESHIINIGSVLSNRFSCAENPAYGASKAATNSLVRDLALLLSEKNICVNSISPALLYRNEESLAFLEKQLSRYKIKCKPTPYSDVLKLIEFITLSGIDSLRGKDIVLDYGLESIEAFDLLSSCQ